MECVSDRVEPRPRRLLQHPAAALPHEDRVDGQQAGGHVTQSGGHSQTDEGSVLTITIFYYSLY